MSIGRALYFEDKGETDVVGFGGGAVDYFFVGAQGGVLILSREV
jgi:hypothetical protein